MGRAVLFAGVLFSLSGCATHLALRNDTVRTTNTLTELQYQQVLDNVARFEADPDTVPCFAVASAGTVSIAAPASAGATPSHSPTLPSAHQGAGALPLLSLIFSLTASPAVTKMCS